MRGERSLGPTLALLGGIAALLAALLGALQVDASRKSSRASAEGSRLAIKIFEETAASGLRLNLVASAAREQDNLDFHAMALRLSAQKSGLVPAAVADLRAAERLRRARTRMLGERPDLTGLREEIAAQRARTDSLVVRQNPALARAADLSLRSGAASRGLLLVATAGALLTLAASLGGRLPAWLTLGTGAILLGTAAATGVVALLA